MFCDCWIGDDDGISHVVLLMAQHSPNTLLVLRTLILCRLHYPFPSVCSFASLVVVRICGCCVLKVAIEEEWVNAIYPVNVPPSIRQKFHYANLLMQVSGAYVVWAYTRVEMVHE